MNPVAILWKYKGPFENGTLNST